MPLVRFEVRNEYGLGDPGLYRAESNKEAPKAILDGVAVAGLVGILRQLGDLAGFAAEIFRDLHDEVMATAARGRKMLTRVQRIESALPLLENAVQGQRSCLHFAYIAGSDWHANVRTGQNQLLCSDLPQFMVNFYEECRDPPHLYLLDKFDSSGAGACLKRYSDPSYFQRALVSPIKAEKVKRKKKKRGSQLRNGRIQNVLFISQDSHSTQFASLTTDQPSFSGENTSFSDARPKSGLTRESIHFDSETRSNCVEQVSDMPCMMPCGVSNHMDFSALGAKRNHSNSTAPILRNEPKQDIADDDSQPESSQRQSAPSASSVTWDEKTEIVKSMGANLYEAELVDRSQDLDPPPQIFETSKLGHETAKEEVNVVELAKEHVSYSGGNLFDEDPIEIDNLASVSCPGANPSDEIPAETTNFAPISGSGANLFDEIPAGTYNFAPVSAPGANLFDEILVGTDNFTDATNTLETETESGSECQTKRELGSSNITCGDLEPRSCGLIESSRTISDSFDAQAPIGVCSSLDNFVLSDCFDHVQSTMCDAPESDISTGNGYSKSHIHCLPGSSATDLIDGEQSPESRSANDQDVSVDNETAYETSNDQDLLIACFDHVQSSMQSPDSRSANDQDVSVDNETAYETSKSPDFPLNASNLQSVTFWTNGGILGVAPSKPPDFIINANPEAAAVGNGSKSRTVCLVEERNESDSDIAFRKNSQESIPASSLVDLHENQAPSSRTCAHTGGPDHGEADVAAPGYDLTAIGNTVSNSNGSDKNLQGISTSVSGLAHKFLSNSLQRRILVAHAGLSSLSKVVNADFRTLQDILLQNDCKELPKRVVPNALCDPETAENIEVESSRKPVSSSSPCFGSSSPPLEHMKISFQPMNGLDTARMKLQFSRGNLLECNGELAFPSFQLVPGTSPALHDSSESDDTFCRSSAFSSNDLLSPHSESSFEFWGEERSEAGKYMVSDDSCKNSLSASSSIKSELMDICIIASEKYTEVESDGIDCIQDLPSINSIIYDQDQQKEILKQLAFGSIDSTSHSPHELPPPLPLPPLQWRVAKQSDKHHSVEDKNYSCMDSVEHADVLSQSSATRELQELGAFISLYNAEEVEHPIEETDQVNLTGNGGPNHNCGAKEQNGWEDTLHQIGSKSSNLRRMTTENRSHTWSAEERH